jgi:hypothetical protein
MSMGNIVPSWGAGVGLEGDKSKGSFWGQNSSKALTLTHNSVIHMEDTHITYPLGSTS